MCGRFVTHSSMSLIEKTFNIDETACETSPNYNVAPTQEVLAVVCNHKKRLIKLHWGLVPFWAKDRQIGSRLINARAETVSQKPSFRDAFKNRRCLIIADGFFEWKGPKGRKQPWYLTLPSGEPFGFAGLWEIWHGNGSEKYRSCTILTTEASESVRDLHHRMPVILSPAAHDTWLNPQNHDVDRLKTILKQEHIRDLKRHPVSARVNNVRNNDPACIEPLETSPH